MPFLFGPGCAVITTEVCRHLKIASIYCTIVGTSHFKTGGINMELALALLLQQPPLLCGSPQNIGTKLKPQETLMKLGCDEARLATDVPIHPNGARWGRGWGSMQVHQVRLHQTPKMNFFMGLFLFVCRGLVI